VTNHDLQRLSDRNDLSSALREMFPHVSATDTALSPIRGGRKAALAAVAQIKPESYARSRNYLDGDVTRLSAYLRHGVLTLAEVRDEVLRRVSTPEAGPAEAGKLINELGWRDYWQRLYVQIGDGIWEDREPIKTGCPAADYATEVESDITEGATTLACMDGFSRQLMETGYLHNHARMWFAAYVVHWRKTRWQAGAEWFLRHLVDGDPASNNLSWQWVASTFASKPYFFNRENLERYTSGAFCSVCPHAEAGTCPFEGEYEVLEARLFPMLGREVEVPALPRAFVRSGVPALSLKGNGPPLVWIHTDGLNPESPMITEHVGAPAVFVWDSEWLASGKISLKRIVFLAECLREMPGTIELRLGDVATELRAAAKEVGAEYILAERTPDPRLLVAAERQEVPVVWYDPPAFVESARGFDLKRFSRYWQRAQASAMERTRGLG
jgi:deoxyribodipyrimidine photo-lyase